MHWFHETQQLSNAGILILMGIAALWGAILGAFIVSG